MSNDPTRDPSSAAEPATRGSRPRRARLLSPTQRGILWMLGSTVLFATVNASAKILTQSYHVVEVLWGRFTFAALFLTVIYGRRLVRTMATRRLGLQLIRSLLTVGSTALFILALHLLPLTDATALLFTGPIFVALLSRPLLSEAVGPGRWLGIAVGFAGAVVITRPGATAFQVAWLVALGAAILFAFYLITTRMLRDLPRCFASRNAKRYTKPRGALLWTTGTTRNTSNGLTPTGQVLLRPLGQFYSAVDTLRHSRETNGG